VNLFRSGTTAPDLHARFLMIAARHYCAGKLRTKVPKLDAAAQPGVSYIPLGERSRDTRYFVRMENERVQNLQKWRGRRD
jgi:hypothetical protein